MKLFLLSLLLLFGLTACAADDVVAAASNTTVEVLDIPSLAHGTGFVYKGSYVITAKHVVVEEGEFNGVLITFHNGLRQFIPAKKIVTSSSVDVAVIPLDDEVPASVKFAPKDPVKGDEVWGVGYPFEYREVLFHGLITGTRADYLVMDATINPGDSGAAVLNKKSEVVGLVVLKDMRSGAYNMCLPVSVVKTEVEKLIAKL